MALKLYNSYTNKKEAFKSLKKNQVLLYVCGITPYDTTHLGHAFLYVHFDVLIRYLKFLGYKVNYTQNITDIDDDILRKSKEEGRDWQELGEFWTNKFKSDLKILNVLEPTHYVKATDSIKRIIKIVDALIKKDFAYKSGNNVYFRVKSFKDYGKLSKYSQKEMINLLSERGGNPSDKNKENSLDFILWQGKKEGEPFWESPFGNGRPGWHIECSAMINEFLGDRIDIHGGGFDLIFPHHESEIAQSESYTNKKPFVNYWMHASMVFYQDEKMSKSLGNLVMVSDLLKKYSGNAIRWAILSNNYRNLWHTKEEEIDEAQAKINKIFSLPYSKKEPDMQKLSKFFKLIEDDLNTKDALNEIERLSANNSNSSEVRAALYILGFLLD